MNVCAPRGPLDAKGYLSSPHISFSSFPAVILCCLFFYSSFSPCCGFLTFTSRNAVCSSASCLASGDGSEAHANAHSFQAESSCLWGRDYVLSWVWLSPALREIGNMLRGQLRLFPISTQASECCQPMIWAVHHLSQYQGHFGIQNPQSTSDSVWSTLSLTFYLSLVVFCWKLIRFSIHPSIHPFEKYHHLKVQPLLVGVHW